MSCHLLSDFEASGVGQIVRNPSCSKRVRANLGGNPSLFRSPSNRIVSVATSKPIFCEYTGAAFGRAKDGAGLLILNARGSHVGIWRPP